MSRSDVHLLDLPDEILLTIMKKLNNIDVLYSLLNINNERLRILAQEKNFSNILNFISIDNNSLIDCRELDRFCNDILPKIHYNVKCLILESVLMERILCVADYPNLTELKLFNFKQDIARCHFKNESPLRYIFQKQITDLILINNDKRDMIGSLKNYTINVYGHILSLFKNLKHLSIIGIVNALYPDLSLCGLPSTTFFSSTLTHLCINVNTFDDCLYLLDGRLEQLTTFIVEIYSINGSSSIVHNMDDLPNLKCFSLKYYDETDNYDSKILPLLHRMSYLEKLTLFLRIINRIEFVDSTHLQNKILVYMPRLHSFTFYICTHDDNNDLFHYSPKNIQQPFTNFGQQYVATIVNYTSVSDAICSIFSLPFAFDRLEDIGNKFPDTVFNYVTFLLVQDVVPFNHEFFVRVARAFPLLNNFRVINIEPQSLCDADTSAPDNSQSYSIAKYPHLNLLDVRLGHIDYVEQFLNETKTYAPHLTDLTISYNDLRIVTENFTREETRRNCTKVQRLIMIGTFVHTKDFYLYFPSL